MNARRSIGDVFLGHHLAWNPVDATFMGLGGAGLDQLLPRADSRAAADERRAAEALRASLAQATPADAGERMDKRIALGELDCVLLAPEARSRRLNPAWYTGEAAFGLIGLLLPSASSNDPSSVSARLRAVPDFLADGRARLREAGAAPASWVARARAEAQAVATFLSEGLPLHQNWQAGWASPAQEASRAFAGFAGALENLADRDPACGTDRLAQIMKAKHGLDATPDALARAAQAAFDRLGAELEEDAERLEPGQSWQAIIDRLAAIHPPIDGVLQRYRAWHDLALEAASGLVTPELGYTLDYRFLSAPFKAAAAKLYFLFYRSPPPASPGSGSVYWVTQPDDNEAALRAHCDANIKLIHAVHHGSIGHHTHNASARACPSVLGRVAGTDCASGIALLSGGMMVEGWACYAEDLLMEAPGFYSPAECLLLKHYERRNAASVLVDIRIHTGEWRLEEAARFYREEAGFAPQRVGAEIVRNSMFPTSRLMYWAGVEAIRGLRRRWHGSTRAFHDTLLGHGHVPVCEIETEMVRLGQIG